MSTTFAALLAHRVETLPQLDFTPFHSAALRLLESDRLYQGQVASILAQDPALCQQLLTVAAIQAGCAIASVQQALDLLGVAFARTFVEEALARRARSHRLDPLVADLLTGEHWEHAQSVAVCAQLLAQATGYSNVAFAYTAGLFHDLGEVVSGVFGAEAVREALALPRQTDEVVLLHGDRHLGFDHAAVGASILSRWGLPLEVGEAVLCHHRPRAAKVNKRLARIVHLADVLMECQLRGLPIGISLFPLQQGILAEFPMERAALARIAEQAELLAGGGMAPFPRSARGSRQRRQRRHSA